MDPTGTRNATDDTDDTKVFVDKAIMLAWKGRYLARMWLHGGTTADHIGLCSISSCK